MTTAPAPRSKNPTLAAILSGLMPGLGQFYVREWAKGATFLVAILILDMGFHVSEGFVAFLSAVAVGGEAPSLGTLALRAVPLLAVSLWSIWDVLHTIKRQSGRR
ncbi:MAG: hypothetical protein ACKOCD_02820 [Nitrospiraceae bacterium]